MKKALPAIFLAVAFLCGGCLHFEQVITLKKDGSMTVSMTYSIPVANLAALTSGHRAITDWQNPKDTQKRPVNWFLDEKAVRAFFTSSENKMEVLAYRKFQRDGRQFAQIIVSARHAAAAFEQGYFGDITLKDNTLAIHFPISLSDLPKEDAAHLRKLCSDLSLSIEVNAPRSIKETNGYRRTSDTAVWILSSNGRGIDIFGKLDDMKVSW